MEACPDNLEGYRELSGFDDKAALASNTARLRALIEPRTDKTAINAYQTLWSMEFKAHPPAEYDALRKKVSADLKQLRALDLKDMRAWYYTLEKGYKLVNDKAQSDWAKDERQRRLPQPWELASAAKWFDDHSRPNGDAPADRKQAYYRDLLKQTEAWLKERPKMVGLWQSRLGAMEYLSDIPDAEVASTADNLMKLAAENAGPDGPDSYIYVAALRVLARRHIHPDQVVDWAEKALAKMKSDAEDPNYDAYDTPENLQESKFYNDSNPINATRFMAGAYIDMKQPAKARTTLAHMEDELEVVKQQVGDKSEFRKAYLTRLAFWWELTARAAQLEGHDQDAMAFYEHALLTRLDAKEPPETGIKDEMAGNARQLWTRLGGSNDGWQVWYGRQADLSQSTLSWEDANLPLPAFEITDIAGKTWTQASMKGKTTFLNFWASW